MRFQVMRARTIATSSRQRLATRLAIRARRDMAPLIASADEAGAVPVLQRPERLDRGLHLRDRGLAAVERVDHVAVDDEDDRVEGPAGVLGLAPEAQEVEEERADPLLLLLVEHDRVA